MSGRTACCRRLWRRLSRIAVSSCHGRPCHVERGAPDMAPRLFKRRGLRPPSDSPGPPCRTPGEAVTRLDELLAQLDLAAHRHGALGGYPPPPPAAPGRAAPPVDRARAN